MLLHFTDKYRPGCALRFIKGRNKMFELKYSNTHTYADFFYLFVFLRPCLFVSSHHLEFWPGTLTSPAAPHHFSSRLSQTGTQAALGSWVMAPRSVFCHHDRPRGEEIPGVMSSWVTHLRHRVALPSAVAAASSTVVWADSLCADEFISAPKHEARSRQSLWWWYAVTLLLRNL